MNRTTSWSLPRAIAAFCAACLLLPASARAVIIDSITGTGNTTAPSDNPGWANVGTVNNGSAVYLGNRWALTATHVWTGSTTFSGTTYAHVPGSEITLSNNGAPGKSAWSDLVLYQLATDPGLPSLQIASSTPANGSAVTMIGAGRDRGALTTWSVNTGTSPFVWTVSSTNVDAEGYLWGSTRTMRWGTNAISGTNWIAIPENGKNVLAFETTFNNFVGNSSEAQAAAGDSGGAVFYKNGGTWELAGMMAAIGGFSGQPQAAVFGNLTYSADLSFYRSQIVTIVPEPGSVALTAIGAAVVCLQAWRRGRMKSEAGSKQRQAEACPTSA
jgi:hypothetical protein